MGAGALVLLLVACAYSPALRSGLLAHEYALLLGGADASGARPLGAAWNLASGALWGLPAPGRSALPFRTENLLVLLASALALRAFLARLTAPWIGEAQARRGASCAALFLALHPLAPGAALSLGARGELCGLALSSLAAALFLHGRQEGRYVWTSASALLCALAGLGSQGVLVAPLFLAGAEYLSAHRYRRRSTRLRTALTTLAVFGAAALLVQVIATPGAELLRSLSAPEALASSGALRRSALERVEELGLLLLPANPLALGVGGSVIAGAVLLIALQPVFPAARNAPRLWSGVLLVFLLALALSQLLRPALDARELDLAWQALPTLAVLAAGLGVTATARSSPGRVVVVALVALGQTAIGHANARPWLRAAGEVVQLRGELLAAREREPGARILVLDPPGPEQGIDPLRGSAAWLLHPRLDGEDGPFEPARVSALSSAAFLAFVGEPEFARLRERPLLLLAASGAGAELPLRRVVRLTAGEPSGAQHSWRRDLRSPPLDLDPLELEAVRVVGTPESELEELTLLGWRSRSASGGTASAGSGTQAGIPLERAGGREVLFDLTGSLSWRLAGRIQYLVLERGERDIERAEVLARLPELGRAVVPGVRAADWVFPRPALETGAPAGGSFVLTLLALGTLESREFLLEWDPEQPASAGLRARGAELFAQAARQGGAPLAWSLDYRIAGQAVARARGRQL